MKINVMSPFASVQRFSVAISLALCMAMSFGMTSAVPLIAATGFFVAIEIFGVSARRLNLPKDHVIKAEDFRSMDKTVLTLMGGWILFGLLIFVSQMLWNNHLLPSFAFSDYRSTSLSDERFRLYAWGCDHINGKPFFTSDEGEYRFVECGKPGGMKMRIAGRKSDVERAMDSYFEAPNKPVVLPVD